MGTVFVADLHLKEVFCQYSLGIESRLVKAYPCQSGDGFIAISNQGEIFHSSIDDSFTENEFTRYIADQSYLNMLIESGKYSNNLIKNLLPNLKAYLDSHDYDRAIDFILKSPQEVLRCTTVLDMLSSVQYNQKQLLTQYIKAVRLLGPLKEEECLWLATISSNIPIFVKVIQKLLEVIFF